MSDYNKVHAYRQLLLDLLPPGLVFTDESTNLMLLLESYAEELVRIDTQISKLIRESNPFTSEETIDARYLEAGLPDVCSLATISELTLKQRKTEVLAKWAARGGSSKAYFLGILEKLNIEATIDELYQLYPPMTVNHAVNYPLYGEYQQLGWRINYVDTTRVDFRAGSSRAGQSLGTAKPIDEFVCIIEKLKPAHTHVIYNPVTSL